MRSNRSKVQGFFFFFEKQYKSKCFIQVYFITKLLPDGQKQTCVKQVKKYVKVIQKSYFLFSLKNTLLLCLSILILSIINFDFTIHLYILVLCRVFGKHELVSSAIAFYQIEKTAPNTDFLTVANTLYILEVLLLVICSESQVVSK